MDENQCRILALKITLITIERDMVKLNKRRDSTKDRKEYQRIMLEMDEGIRSYSQINTELKNIII